MKIDPILSAIIDTADAANVAHDDYINPEDGLKYCGKFHTPKEAYFADNPPFCAKQTNNPNPSPTGKIWFGLFSFGAGNRT